MQAPPDSQLALRRRVDDELHAFLDRRRAAFDSAAVGLFDEIEAVVSAGGKRLRPVFCYWGYRAAGGDDGPGILRVGAALELLHTFAIVHDDVMDRSPIRRGRPASYRAFEERARRSPHRGDPERFGVSAAVLAGDLALMLADTLLEESGFDEDALGRARARFGEMRLEAVAGQYLDLVAAHRGNASEAEARRINTLKSGGYSVADPLRIGAALAGPASEPLEALLAYGRPLGQAFQVRDDVLSVFGDPALTGKDRDGDLREGKQTVLLAKARALAAPQQRSVLDERVGRPDLTAADAEGIRAVMRATGALHATLTLVSSLVEEAKAALDTEVLEPAAVPALCELADLVEAREG